MGISASLSSSLMKREKIYTTPYNGIINNKLVLASFLNRIFDITFTYKLSSDLVD